MLICIKQVVYTFLFYFLRQTLFSFCTSSLGTQQQLVHAPVKSSTFPLRKMRVFQGVALRQTKYIHPASSLAETQQQLTHPPAKSLLLPLWKNYFSQVLLLCNVLILSCLGTLWFGTDPHYSLEPYMRLFYLWSISLAKDRRYLKYYTLCLVYFYSEKPLFFGGVQPDTLLELANIRFQFFFRQIIRKQYYGLPQESP